MSYEPLIPPAVWVTLALATAAAMGWYAFHRPRGFPRPRWFAACGLMCAGAALVMWLLLNPTWLEPIPPPPGKPLVTVLVDTSESMATRDADANRSRLEHSAKLAADVAAALPSQYELRLRRFAEAAAPLTADELAVLKAGGRSTDLGAAIGTSLETDRPQGQAIVLLSDGAHNAPGGISGIMEIVQTARAMGAPVYTHTVGTASQPQDLEVIVPRPQELAFQGQTIPLSAAIRQRGRLTDRVAVVLLSDDKEIARQEISLQPDATVPVTFKVPATASGLHRYEVRISPVEGEASPANNAASLQLRVVQDPIRVLVLEGKPYWDGKFFVRTLAADAAVEIDFLVQLAPQRFLKRSLRLVRTDAAGPGAAAPSDVPAEPAVRRTETSEMLADPQAMLVDPQGLKGVQVIVLGRDADAFLTDDVVERIRTWISRDGGSLVCYRGSPVANPDQALSRLLPVRWSPSRESRFRVQVTDRGQNLPWLLPPVAAGERQTLGKLPSLVTSAKAERLKPLAVVLGRSESQDSQPVVTYQPYGAGRVVAVEGAGMWRWAFLAPQYQSHEAVYGTLWQSLLRWLVSSAGLIPGQDTALFVDRVHWTAGDAATAVLIRRGEADRGAIGTVDLTREGTDWKQSFVPTPAGDEPGVYQVFFGELEEGRYRGRLTGAAGSPSEAVTTIAFDVRANLGEQLDIAARADLMQAIAESSGGAVLNESNLNTIGQQFRDYLSRTRPERVRRTSAWDRWWIMAGLLALWGTAWALRRSGGLV